MTRTTLQQNCEALYDPSGTLRFQIASLLETAKPGDLPHEDIFVHAIQNTTDPKSDQFLRVANVLDLSQLPRGRDRAVSGGSREYLRRLFTVAYDDVDTATMAKSLIQTRVDNLIGDWIKYTNQFTDPSIFELPFVEAPVAQERIGRHQEASKIKGEKEAALEAAAEALREATAEAARATTALTDATKTQIQCSAYVQQLSSALTAVQTFWGSATTFIADARASNPGNTTFPPQIKDFEQTLTNQKALGPDVLTTLLTTMASNCEVAQSTMAQKALLKTQADTAVAAATTQHTIAEAELTAAVTAEEAALAAVLEVCPSYNPT